MTAEVNIRRAQLADSKALAIFLAEAMPEDWRMTHLPKPEDCQRSLLYAGTLALIAHETRGIVGLAQGFILPNFLGRGDDIMLDNVLVHPGFRNRGIGTALVTEFVTKARQIGQKPVQIWGTTDTPHEPARRPFELAGGVRGALFREFNWQVEDIA